MAVANTNTWDAAAKTISSDSAYSPATTTTQVPALGLLSPQVAGTASYNAVKSSAPGAATVTNANAGNVNSFGYTAANAGGSQRGNAALVDPSQISNTNIYQGSNAALELSGQDAKLGTVEGRLNGIIATDSPLQQQARTTANKEIARRGLLNSSMAVGAGQDAVISSALPIANADAASFNQFALTNQTATNDNAKFNATANQSANADNARSLNQTEQLNSANRQQASITNAAATNSADSENAALRQQTELNNIAAMNRAAEFGSGASNAASAQNATLATNVNLNNAQAANQAALTKAEADKQVALANMQADNAAMSQNAQTAADVAKFNAQQANTIAATEFDAQNKASLFNAEILSKAGAQAADNAMKVLQTVADKDTKEYLAAVDANSRSLIQTNAGAASLFSNYVQMMAQIMTSSTLDEAGKTTAIDNLKTGLKDGLAIQGAIADLNLSGLLV